MIENRAFFRSLVYVFIRFDDKIEYLRPVVPLFLMHVNRFCYHIMSSIRVREYVVIKIAVIILINCVIENSLDVK